MTDFKDFKGAAKRIEDLDLPRIAHRIGVGEDELHALIDTETNGKGFDAKGRPRMLFEPHRFYANLPESQRDAAVKAGLARKTWKVNGKVPKYPADSYPRLIKAMAINETAALKSASWGLGQIMGENHKLAGYETPQSMVRAFMADEEHHLDAMVNFIIASKIDDDLRVLAELDRPTRPEDTIPIVRVYNGSGYAANDYHTKFAANHNKWRNIKDTAWSPDQVVIQPEPVSEPVAQTEDLIASVQQLLRDKGYPEVGKVDNVFGTRTRNAILAFQADNNLPLTGVITDELLAQLIKAPARQNSAMRETVTAKDLKEQGDKTVQNADWLRKVGMGILVSMGLGGVSEGVVNLDDIRKGIGDVRSLIDAVGTLGPWVIGIAGGALVLWFGSKVIREQVEAFREGRSV